MILNPNKNDIEKIHRENLLSDPLAEKAAEKVRDYISVSERLIVRSHSAVSGVSISRQTNRRGAFLWS